MAATHDEIKSVTHAIRQDLKGTGELGDGQNFTKHAASNWTETQKKQTKNYPPGQVLEFHRATKRIQKHEALEVIRADESGITARRANGQDVQITARQVKAFSVFEKDVWRSLLATSCCSKPTAKRKVSRPPTANL